MDSDTQALLLEALCHRQRLDLTGEITGAVAHDLNNALSVVNGNVELLLERLQEPDARVDAELLQDARTARNWSATAMTAARRLLHFSRQLRAPAKPVAANGLASEAVELCRYRCEVDGLLLMSDLTDDVGEVHVPPGQMLQILIALIQNAREALAGAGEGGAIHMSTTIVDSQVRFEVEDDGPGISEDLTERVFELGYSTKEGGQPTGFGLSIGRYLARAYGGDLTIGADAQGGGRQILVLPQVS
ncbi:MAG: HAMP domain-containing histidine kinase [Gemmatimonadetes bacterium]|jgi:two-component system C4-dicarboxylate transport sensor histidine kinase DctB|nr:HAMP domain-containing histidine kinase [Gemmatimonadota bacterium]MBT5141467.1 HAMP domain-containing histidine kinase [Gemmatimonadota bacterium]MBT5590700.1 HAMP domain-containing histidine kinase [Gemmatimonadota bacterium]MBT5965165.1 HAMP domain-containing histidine kinase [Gemmatimonadota bacterium]MBT6625850.1 HAMP domain-containing histidine kinase [Gemmatimonadota bacterium]